MTKAFRERKPLPPLDPDALRAMALRYVERFATSRGRLERYLNTKLRQRGWHEETPPDVAALVARVADAGYVDDESFAQARAGGMERRGLGARRVRQQLSADGIDADTREQAAAATRAGAAALTLMRRKRLGPFGPPATDPKARQKQMGAMLRGGHDPRLAARLLAARTPADAEEEAERHDEERAGL